MDSAVRGADTAAVTVDGAGEVNGKSTYNVMVCLPKPLLLGSFRVGLTVSSDPNLLLAFRGSLPASRLYPLTDTTQKWPVTRTSQRLLPLGSRRLWALCTENASVMVSMRTAAEAGGLVLASYGCFAHAVNLVNKELCARAPFLRVLNLVIAATVFFVNDARGRARIWPRTAPQKRRQGTTSTS